MDYSDFEVETFLRTGQHEAELRREFGNALYEDLVAQAQATSPELEAMEAVRQQVFILPGILGSKLSASVDGVRDLVWIDPIDLAFGGVAKLKWSGGAGGIVATGVVLATYLKMKLNLRLAGFAPTFLPYDWRFAPAAVGVALIESMRKKGLRNVAIVAHSMGGLVAREMAAHDPDRETISRIVTLGTPNLGSYSPIRILVLKHGMLETLGRVDQKHTAEEIVRNYLRALPGLLQMMPAPPKRPGESYFDTGGWPKNAVVPAKGALAAALSALEQLPEPDARTVQIVGVGHETIRSGRLVDGEFRFALDRDGDGTVPRDLAEMGSVTRYYVECEHGQLCNHSLAIRAVADILRTGTTSILPQSPPVSALETGKPREMSETEVGIRVHLANEHVIQPVETDFAGDFLGRDPAAEAAGPPPATGMPRPSIGGDMFGATPSQLPSSVAYPIEVINAARGHWEQAEVGRTMVERMVREGRPLQAESAVRLDKYVKRLLQHFEALPEARGTELARRLRETLGVMEAAQGSAASPAMPDVRLERVIGKAEEFLSVMFVKRAVLAMRSVGRIVDSGRGIGFGTGFLIAPNVLMTNNHVLPDAFAAQHSTVEFLYELDVGSHETAAQEFRLEPHRLFYSDGPLDFTIVAVAQKSKAGSNLTEFGHLPLVGVEGKIRKGQSVNIIQHPAGERKQVVFRDSILSDLPEDIDYVAHYTGDTKPGSSGSPVFSDAWEVVALHHSGVPDKDTQGNWLTLDGQPWNRLTDPGMVTVKWVSNEGIRISRIIRHLQGVPNKLMLRGEPGGDLVAEALATGEKALRDGIYRPPPVVVPTSEQEGAAKSPSNGDPGLEPLQRRSLTAPSEQVELRTESGLSVQVPLTVTLSLGLGRGAPEMRVDEAGPPIVAVVSSPTEKSPTGSS